MERKIIIGLVAALVISLLLLQRQCSTIGNVRDALAQTEQEVVTWKDKEGRSRAKVEEVTLDYKTYKITQQKIQDSLKALGIKEKIVYIAGATTVVHDTIETVVKDTVVMGVNALTFNYTDEWSRINGVVKSQGVQLSYSIKNELKLVSYKKGFLKRRTYVEAISMNPNVQIAGMSTLSIKNGKAFSFGPQVGVAYIDNRLQPYIGVGVGYNLFRF